MSALLRLDYIQISAVSFAVARVFANFDKTVEVVLADSVLACPGNCNGLSISCAA